MDKVKKSPQQSPNAGVECARCHKHVAPENGQQRNSEFICNECLATAKRNKLVCLIVAIVCCIAAAITWFYLSNSDKKTTATGFDGTTEFNDSVNIEMDSVKVEFNLATATITSAPVSTQAPINNIDEFKRIVNQNVEAAKSSNTNSITIPTTAIQFGFDSAVLTQASLNLIQEIATFYNSTSKENTIEIDGYACNIGENEPNDYISQQRADAVKAAFISNGIDASKISTHWFGKSKNSEFNLPKNEDNRRVLISIK